ncbi:hypothetical protein PtB15_3B394 [Puccinia triticina]|nr:hypothetical protein PtB15_3B394 [Puccinia triticina]
MANAGNGLPPHNSTFPQNDLDVADGKTLTTPRSPPPIHPEAGAPVPSNSAPKSTTTVTTEHLPPPSEGTARCPSPQLTIVKYEEIQNQVIAIAQECAGPKLTWSRLSQIHCRPPPVFNCNVPPAHTRSDDFLTPSHNEQWYCPNVIDFPLLTKFSEKQNPLPPGSFIPTTSKCNHPKSTIVRCFYRLHQPPQNVVAEWARIVVASMELSADNLFSPPPVSSNLTNDHFTRGVEALYYLETLKNGSSTFDPPPPHPDPSTQPAHRMHSVDVLHDFWNLIIEVLMAYIILQTHSLAKAPLKAAQKKAKTRANQVATNTSDQTLPAIQPASSAVAPSPKDATQKLQRYQKKQNFQPLV